MHPTTRRYLTLLFCLALLVPLASLMVGAIEPAQAATARIHGTVRLNDGNPGTALGNIKVIFWRRDGGLQKETYTHADGYYESPQMDDAGVGFNVAMNKPAREGAMPGEPGLNPAYSYNETPNIYFSNSVGGWVVVDATLRQVSGSPPTPPTPAPSGTTSDLFGLAINANYPETNPPDRDLADLGVRWVRSIKYQKELRPHGNVNWLVIFNQESIPQNGGESWNDYANRFAQEVKNQVAATPGIRAVQIWNEPDTTSSNAGPHLAEKDYAVLLKATYLKVKELPNPPTVVFAGLCSGPGGAASYVKNVRSFWNGQIYYDAVGFHPYMATCGGYGWSGRGTIQDNINTLYAQTGGRQIWLTEFGGPIQFFGNDENRQAAYLDCLYRTIPTEKDGTKSKVGVAFWFAWDDRTHYLPNAESYGLVRQNWLTNTENPSAYRRPAWLRYQALARASIPAPSPVVFSDGMENGIGLWKSYLADFSASTDQKHAGSASMKATGKGPVYAVKDGKTVSGGVYLQNFAQVTPNTKYEVSAWVYNPSSTGVQANLYVQQYRGADSASKVRDTKNAFIHDEYAVKTVAKANGWQKMTVTFTTHREANYLNPSLCTRETGKPVHWDDVQIRKV